MDRKELLMNMCLESLINRNQKYISIRTFYKYISLVHNGLELRFEKPNLREIKKFLENNVIVLGD